MARVPGQVPKKTLGSRSQKAEEMLRSVLACCTGGAFSEFESVAASPSRLSVLTGIEIWNDSSVCDCEEAVKMETDIANSIVR